MQELFAIKYSYLIPLLPLAGAMISGFLGARWLKGNSHWPIWIGVGGSAILSILLLVGMLRGWQPHGQAGVHQEGNRLVTDAPRKPDDFRSDLQHLSYSQDWYTWIAAGSFKATAGFFFDPLTAVMLCVVTGIGFFITVYAKGYMAGEAGYFRFFAYLGLFIFAMTVLVMGNNFLMLYLGWEGVGLCSYLLIGYYYEKPSAREAAKKAFLVNRIGDFGFGLGIMLIYVCFGTVSYFADGAGNFHGVLDLATYVKEPNLIPGMTAWKAGLLPWIPFLLMLGAFGKSAQFPLYVWLPDAMEGPTPVSALIHAATMVTAGVYMIVRCGTLFVPNSAAMLTIAAVGSFTALFAATIALRQFDLKKVFAYSTISQLGFMFAAVGVLAPVAGIFHLVTHAFFKALLFLSSGVVMHAMLGHLDMRKMSGLKRVLPATNLLMLIGCLALAGVPLFSGFFSKDEIVGAAWGQNRLVAAVLLLTAFLTAYYTFRLYFRVFQGPLVVPGLPAEAQGHVDHDEADAHAHASAAAVVVADVHESGVDRQLVHDSAHHGPHNHEPMVMILPLVVLAIGAAFAGYLNWPERVVSLGHFLGESPSLKLAMPIAGPGVSPAAFGAEVFEAGGLGKKMEDTHLQVMFASATVAALGIYLAYLLHLKYRDRGEALAARFPHLSRVLEAKYWVDEIYQAGIVEPLRMLGRAFFAIDRFVVDGVVWAIGFIPQVFGFSLKLTTQRGSLQGYALAMLLGVAVILLVMFW